MRVASSARLLTVLFAGVVACGVTRQEPAPPIPPAVATAPESTVAAGDTPAVPEPTGTIGAAAGKIGDCRERGPAVAFTLAHVNDLQARYSERIDGKSRYARIAGLLRSIKDEVPATLVLDAGDDYEKGSLLELRTNGASTRRIVHAMPFDVRTLGNHDFAYGEAAVRADVKASPHIVLAANVRDPEDPDLFRAFVRIDVGCARVGVLGLVTQPYGSDDDQDVNGPYGTFTQEPRVVRVADEIVQKHRGEVDVMIALTHLGKGADTYLAHEVDGIDLVVGGHSEDLIPKPQRVTRKDGTSALVLQAGHFGEQVGRAEVVISLDEKRVDIARYRLLPVDGTAPADDGIEKLVNKLETEGQPGLLEPIATVAKERSASELVTLTALAAKRTLKADAVLMGKDAFWGKLAPGPLSLQRLYDLVLAQKQPVGTPGFTALYTVELGADDLARLKKALRRNSRFALEAPGPLPSGKRKLRLAVEKRVVEHPTLAFQGPLHVVFPGAELGGELIDVLAPYARAAGDKGVAFDSAL